MKRAAIFTLDPYLFKKTALSLPGFEVIAGKIEADALGCDAVFVDLDTAQIRIDGAVTMSRDKACDLAIPFPIDAPLQFANGPVTPSCTLIREKRSVILLGEEIRLTELEFDLFELIVGAGDGFVSREKILESVWGSDVDGGIINVYVHYLREKLERGGEKIIVASRGRGYTLSEKYKALFWGGRKNA